MLNRKKTTNIVIVQPLETIQSHISWKHYPQRFQLPQRMKTELHENILKSVFFSIFCQTNGNESFIWFNMINKKKRFVSFFAVAVTLNEKRYEYITSNWLNKINRRITMNVQCSWPMAHAHDVWITLFVHYLLLEWIFDWTVGKQIIGSMRELRIFHSSNCWIEIDRHL